MNLRPPSGATTLAQDNPSRRHTNSRTSVTLRELRADALHRLLLTPRGQVTTLEDLGRLPDLAAWNPEALAVAVADLVADGRLVDDEYGRPHAEEAA